MSAPEGAHRSSGGGRGTRRAPERLLHRLEWQVVRRLEGQLPAAHRARAYGAGLDVADLRAYVPGDDVRHIDWNVTARLDEPHVRRYTEDRDITAWLLVDRSASMAFGPSGRGKDVVMAELATALASVLVRRGNRVGAILYDRTVERTIPPRTGRAHVLRMAHELMRPPPGDGGATDLSGLLQAAQGTLKRRSLVFLLSDFLSAPGWERRLGDLARRHELVAIQVVDPLEGELPDVGLIVVQDAETGEQVLVSTSDPVFRGRLEQVARDREAALLASTSHAGVDLYRLSTDEDVATALVRMVRDRAARAR